ncbi:MAG: FtsK/SpoIIIE domain-containing protein [Angustibacter sp.]
MRFGVTVVDGRGDRWVDVALDAEPEQPLAELVPALTALLDDPVHPSFAAHVPLWVDGRPADSSMSLRGNGIRPGSVVALYLDPGTCAEPGGVAELRVVGGPGAGRVHRLRLGETVVGCGAPGWSLPDLLLPSDALRVVATPDGEVAVRSADGLIARLADKLLSADGERADGKRADGKRSDGERADGRRSDGDGADGHGMPWPVGEYLSVGGTVLQRTEVGVPVAEAGPGTEHAGVDVVRPPRLLPPSREVSFTLPVEPGERPRTPIPWLMVFAPALIAIPMFFFFGPRAIVFAAMSPLLALANVVSSRRGSRREHRRATERYQRDLADVEERIAVGLRAERDQRRDLGPDPALVLLTALAPGRRLWERRRTDPDHLVLRLGLADQPATATVRHPRLDPSRETPPLRTLADVPAGVALREVGVVGLAGPAEPRDAVARWLVAQTAVLHSPRDVRVVVLTDADSAERWDWTRWLPHLVDPDGLAPVSVGTDQESTGRRLAELTRLVTERTAARSTAGYSATAQAATGYSAGGRSGLPPAPDVLVVLDGARRLRALPAVVQLLRDGPPVGVYLLCLDDEARQLPEECRAVVDLDDLAADARVVLRRSLAEDVPGIRPDLVEVAWARRLARALAPLRDTTPEDDDVGLPASARLLDLLDLEPPTPDALCTGWSVGPASGAGGAGRTDVVVGVGFDGPFQVDLRRDGPHALVAGTTGAGKSELLQTLVAALAVANRPDQLTFVLVDYKGGAAFRDCARLPHTVGLVTDLDQHLVSRALTSLGAELRRREHVLAAGGAKDLEDYLALRATDPALPTLPRLVLVIDEFAGLVAELPDFVTGLVAIAQRGRSLGIHLVLATQRPTGVVSPEIRANTNLRIALRVTDDGESRDVIDAPDAARIARATPGRAFVRTGHSSLMPFQAGRVGGRRPTSSTAQPRRPAISSRLSPASVDSPASRPTTAVPTVRPVPLVWPVPWQRAGLPAPTRPAPGGPSGTATDEGATDLSELVTAVTTAARRVGVPVQPSPWLPPLPDVVRSIDLTVATLPPATLPPATLPPATLPLAESASGDGAAAVAQVVDPNPDLVSSPALTQVSKSVPEPAPWALEDHPAQQRQSVRAFGLGRDGHLYVVGGPRSGRSTVLRTLVTSLAERVPARDLHVYGLDCGNGALLPLGELPHTGAVVQRTQVERADRLLRRLSAQVGQRQEVLAVGGFADLAEQRSAAAPDQRLPYLVLALDRWEGFVSALGELDGGRLADEVQRLLREGTSVGVHVLISGDRTLLAGRMGALVEDKLVLRLPDRTDYALAGLTPRQIPDALPDGRGLWGESGVELQVAVLPGELSGAGQAAAVRAVAARAAVRDAAMPRSQQPFRLAALPAEVDAVAVLDQAFATASSSDLPASDLPGLGLPGLGLPALVRSPLWFPFGVGGDDLDLLGLDLSAAPVAMVAGLAGSGRTAVLRLCAETARRRGQQVLGVCPRPGGLVDQLTGLPGGRAVAGAGAASEELVEALRALPASSLVLVDDAELLRDGPLAAALQAVVRQAREKDWAVVVAGQTTDLSAGLSGWLHEARRGRQGLLLSPTTLMDAEVVSTRLTRSQLASRVVPGRGLLVRQGREPLAVQVPWLG